MYYEWINTLDSCVLFSGIGRASLNIMLDCLKPRVSACKQREIIVAYPQSLHGIRIIASEKITLSKETCSGNRIIMGILDT